MTTAVKGSAAGGKTAWKIFFALMVILAAVWAMFPGIRSNELALGWIGSAWAFCSFWQQQDLEKTRFFFELFNRFNERYNVLNDDLDRIARQDGPLDASDRQIVVDYFNLCAEEFMFYRRGYIPADVWAAWSNGIRYYKGIPRFVTAWREECSTNSHYGFDFDRV